jgi:hypothetical protein
MTDLIERAGDLKLELVRFARSERFAKELRKAQASDLDWQTDAINNMDHFILQHHLEDGLTIVDHFVEEHTELSPEERATQLFRILFPRPRFSWKRDGMKLLQRYKWRQALKPPLPSIIPLSERLSQANAVPSAAAAPSAGAGYNTGKKVGRNEPCPCGSGKKYKHCCG